MSVMTAGGIGERIEVSARNPRRGSGRCRWGYVLLLTSICLSGGWGQVSTSVGLEVWESGHVDIVFDYRASAGWQMGLRREGGGLKPMDAVLLRVKDAAFPGGSRLQRPADARWDFTGVAAGEPLWLLPASEQGGLLWPGIAAEGSDPAELGVWLPGDDRLSVQAGKWVAVDLEEMRYVGSGHGAVSLWIPGNAGEPVVFWSSHTRPPNGNRWYLPAGSHGHMNWGFSAPGLYELSLRASTVLADQGSIESEPQRLLVWVGDLSPSHDYATWAMLHFSPQQRDAGMAAPADDPFDRGIANGLAYALGLRADDNPASLLPKLDRNHNRVTVFQFVSRQGFGSSRVIVEHSSNLLDWREIASASGSDPWTMLDPACSLVESNDVYSRQIFLALPAADAHYLRLQAIP